MALFVWTASIQWINSANRILAIYNIYFYYNYRDNLSKRLMRFYMQFFFLIILLVFYFNLQLSTHLNTFLHVCVCHQWFFLIDALHLRTSYLCSCTNKQTHFPIIKIKKFENNSHKHMIWFVVFSCFSFLPWYTANLPVGTQWAACIWSVSMKYNFSADHPFITFGIEKLKLNFPAAAVINDFINNKSQQLWMRLFRVCI